MAIIPGEASQRPGRVLGFEDLTFDPASPVSQTITVLDSGVQLDSMINASVRVGAGRDGDELDMDPILVTPGAIVAGVSFEVIAMPATEHSSPEGVFRVLYERW